MFCDLPLQGLILEIEACQYFGVPFCVNLALVGCRDGTDLVSAVLNGLA